MNAPDKQSIFKEMDINNFYTGESREVPKSEAIMLEEPEIALYDIFAKL